MKIDKIRFIEPGNPPYKPGLRNLFVYEETIRNPSVGMLTLTTIVKERVVDTLMYSESISKILWDDVFDADVIFIGIFTFAATRGYELAKFIKDHSNAMVVMGGLHASMTYPEAINSCDYVLLGECDESILDFLYALKFGNPVKFPGIAYLDGGKLISTGSRRPPERFDTVPDSQLLYNYRKMAGHNTLWPQVHASRGCPHNCDYCAVVRHFGNRVRTRSVDSVLNDIRQAIDFHDAANPKRKMKMLWLTDDNFFADRKWAVTILKAIAAARFSYNFTVQARFEVGFDDEMLDLLKLAGFTELAVGIEFLENESFELYNKSGTREEIVRSIENIQSHGLGVRGLFILGADSHTKGIGKRLAEFVKQYRIKGVLLQSMYFVPGTPAYDTMKERLLHRDWSKYNGSVVHRPANMTPAELQLEIIRASRRIYSRRNLIKAWFKRTGIEHRLFIGEYLWQKSVRRRLRRELPDLRNADKQ
ncbi:MAG: B12-binding domain-containing radical SAM protein [Oscillospiraceae bacterium]|jgi:radical SAM superfamily enzyme YgiQ (UPF0313 family)|nr:B12-binding domain-containing radical SAM protein [Oscillospiraceae bacterium]